MKRIRELEEKLEHSMMNKGGDDGKKIKIRKKKPRY